MVTNQRLTYFDVILTRHKVMRVKALSVSDAMTMSEDISALGDSAEWNATDCVPSDDQSEEDDSDIYTIKEGGSQNAN